MFFIILKEMIVSDSRRDPCNIYMWIFCFRHARHNNPNQTDYARYVQEQDEDQLFNRFNRLQVKIVFLMHTVFSLL